MAVTDTYTYNGVEIREIDDGFAYEYDGSINDAIDDEWIRVSSQTDAESAVDNFTDGDGGGDDGGGDQDGDGGGDDGGGGGDDDESDESSLSHELFELRSPAPGEVVAEVRWENQIESGDGEEISTYGYFEAEGDNQGHRDYDLTVGAGEDFEREFDLHDDREYEPGEEIEVCHFSEETGEEACATVTVEEPTPNESSLSHELFELRSPAPEEVEAEVEWENQIESGDGEEISTFGYFIAGDDDQGHRDYDITLGPGESMSETFDLHEDRDYSGGEIEVCHHSDRTGEEECQTVTIEEEAAEFLIVDVSPPDPIEPS